MVKKDIEIQPEFEFWLDLNVFFHHQITLQIKHPFKVYLLSYSWKSHEIKTLLSEFDNQNMALVNYLNFMACACAQKPMT